MGDDAGRDTFGAELALQRGRLAQQPENVNADVAVGQLEVTSRRPWRSAKRVPADPDAAFAPLIRVRAALDPARPATVSDVVLAGLAIACGLGPRVLPFGPAGGRQNLQTAIRRLHPGLRELIAHTQAAVDSALLSHRV